MRISKLSWNWYLATMVILLSGLTIAINFFAYHFPGNNYFPPDTVLIGVLLLFMYAGFRLRFGQDSKSAKILIETFYFFIIISIIALATNAVQLTPFSPIDKKIVSLELSLGINLKAIIAWTHSKPVFKELLELIYNSLPLQMCYIPLFIIVVRKTHLIREYYFFLLVSTLVGFSFYYFFPTLAPASVITSPYFNAHQLATHIKFEQIHQWTQPTTLHGGLIALPSFHVIWAWFCLYLVRDYPIIFTVLLPVNVLLTFSCVLLGWHYVIDLIGSLFIILSTHSVYYFYKRNLDDSITVIQK